MVEQGQKNIQDRGSSQQILVMRNIMDNQLESCDDIEIGRVADIGAEWRPDGRLILTNLLTGPEALAGRVSSHLRPIVHFFLHARFEHCIPITEIDDFQPTLRLRGKAIDYSTGQSDRWIANHIFRWIPGSGWRKWHEQQQAHETSEKQEQERQYLEQPVQPQLTHPNRAIVRIEDLIGSKIVTAEGKQVGHVVDIRITHKHEPQVIALVYGESGWLYRLGVFHPFFEALNLKFKPYTVSWQDVEKFEHLTVTLKPGYQKSQGEVKTKNRR
jgi:sporulation protein YlmC with PRC-barrel domain